MKKEYINPQSVGQPNPPHRHYAWPERGATPAIKVSGGSLVFISGQVAVDAEGNTVGPGDASIQTRQILGNIEQLLMAAGGSIQDVVKLVVYLPELRYATDAWKVRDEYFQQPAPCSTGLEVKALGSPDWCLEVDAWAVIPD